MADIVFNRAKGAVAELVRDDGNNIGILLLTVNEADATLGDHDTVESMLAGANTEAVFTNYAQKTALVGTVTVDDTNSRVDVDVPDQTWSTAGGASNETLTKAIVYYDEGDSPASQIPLTSHDFAVTTDGSDLTLQVNSAGFYRAS